MSTSLTPRVSPSLQDDLKKLVIQTQCPSCGKSSEDKMTIISMVTCGHHYCRKCIEQFAVPQQKCLVCLEQFKMTDLKEDQFLTALMKMGKELEKSENQRRLERARNAQQSLAVDEDDFVGDEERNLKKLELVRNSSDSDDLAQVSSHIESFTKQIETGNETLRRLIDSSKQLLSRFSDCSFEKKNTETKVGQQTEKKGTEKEQQDSDEDVDQLISVEEEEEVEKSQPKTYSKTKSSKRKQKVENNSKEIKENEKVNKEEFINLDEKQSEEDLVTLDTRSRRNRKYKRQLNEDLGEETEEEADEIDTLKKTQPKKEENTETKVVKQSAKKWTEKEQHDSNEDVDQFIFVEAEEEVEKIQLKTYLRTKSNKRKPKVENKLKEIEENETEKVNKEEFINSDDKQSEENAENLVTRNTRSRGNRKNKRQLNEDLGEETEEKADEIDTLKKTQPKKEEKPRLKRQTEKSEVLPKNSAKKLRRLSTASPVISESSLRRSTRRDNSFGRSQSFCLLLSSNLQDKQKQVYKLASRLNADVVNEWDDRVTHLIAKVVDNKKLVTIRTVKYLKALLGNKWIVSHKWVSASLQSDKFVDESDYEIQGVKQSEDSKAPSRSRVSKKKLLENSVVYFKGDLGEDVPPVAEFQELVKLAGGQVIESEIQLEKAKKQADLSKQKILIVTKSLGIPDTQDHVKFVQVHTFLDCLANFEQL